ncbi:MAG: lipoate--protein ligase family protein [Halapricum sp.]
MDVRRGRAETIEADQAVTDAVVDHARTTRESTARVWCPPRQVAFGRRDARSEGYERARTAAEQRDFPAVERDVGGRAVAFSGQTVAFVHARPVEDGRATIQQRYDDATELLRSVLADLGVDARPGEPEGSFCPGTHSLQAGGKLAGLAQRVKTDVATVAGVVVTDREGVIGVLDAVYDCLGVPFDLESVGSVQAAGGPPDSEVVADAIAEALAESEK